MTTEIPFLARQGDLPLVMGIVNVTPDSFSDGGDFLAPRDAVRQALKMVEDGAAIIDLGAESTRPGGGVYGSGMSEVSADEETARLIPVVETLRRQTEALISVDTRKGAVARAALDAGADLINDVSGLADAEMVTTLAAADCPVVLMHSRGDLATMQQRISFRDVAQEVEQELMKRVAVVEREGIERHRIILDPGIGFGKTAAQNITLLATIAQLATATSLPVLVGASRKSFIPGVTDDGSGPRERLGGSLAAIAAAAASAAIVRVHDVAETVQFLHIARAIDDITNHRLPPAVR